MWSSQQNSWDQAKTLPAPPALTLTFTDTRSAGPGTVSIRYLPSRYNLGEKQEEATARSVLAFPKATLLQSIAGKNLRAVDQEEGELVFEVPHAHSPWCALLKRPCLLFPPKRPLSPLQAPLAFK